MERNFNYLPELNVLQLIDNRFQDLRTILTLCLFKQPDYYLVKAFFIEKFRKSISMLKIVAKNQLLNSAPDIIKTQMDSCSH